MCHDCHLLRKTLLQNTEIRTVERSKNAFHFIALTPYILLSPFPESDRIDYKRDDEDREDDDRQIDKTGNGAELRRRHSESAGSGVGSGP